MKKRPGKVSTIKENNSRSMRLAECRLTRILAKFLAKSAKSQNAIHLIYFYRSSQRVYF